jgi:tripartite ATP-independent transporter DctM subunit
MELFFICLLIVLMMVALGSGFPVAFSLPGSAVVTVAIAGFAGWLFLGNPDAFFTQDGPTQWLTAGVTNFRGVYWEAERDTLIAIPLFVFMGIMLQRSRIAEDLLVTMAQLFGPVRGGLGMSVVFVGALLAATTGIVGATVVAMGLISLPAMLRNNYSHPLATGTIAASGTLGQIIPPSIVLIILADQLSSATDQASSARKALYKLTTGELSLPSQFDVSSTSAGEMFLGAFIPGLCLVAVYMVYILFIAFVRPRVAPAVPYDGKYDWRFAGRVVMALVPPLALIFIVLGSIILGIATVNQAGAIGAVGAMIMGGYRLREGKPCAYWPAVMAFVAVAVIVYVASTHPINVKKIITSDDVYWLIVSSTGVVALLIALLWSGWRVLTIDNTLHGVMVETAKTTALVFVILMGATMLTAAFRGFGGEDLVRTFLTGLPGGFWGQFFTVMAVIFILGFFLDFIEISVVVVPIVAPILLANPGANVTAVWLGVMIGVNIQTSFLTPPFGFALFYLRGVAPAFVKTLSMYKGVIPFIIMQLMVLVFVAFTPRTVNYLPQRVTLTASTAPPPVNPNLQHCIEQRNAEQFKSRGPAIRAAIATARKLDLASLPEELRNDVKASFGKAEASFDLLGKVSAGEAAIDAARINYAPLHYRVRDIQADIHRQGAEINELQADLRRIPDDDKNAQSGKQALNSEIAALQQQRKALQSQIPANWEAEHKKFAQLLQADRRARLLYRRNVDNAYDPIHQAINVIDAAPKLEALKSDLEGLRGIINSQTPEKASDRVGDVLGKVNTVSGADNLREAVSKTRRALRGTSPDKNTALKALDDAMKVYAADLDWRRRAARELLPGLRAYNEAIHDTIGLRKQEKLPHAVAVDLAGCLAYHRDISLYF